jgi:CRP/FNR family transcriptional regulator, cyclic AMP receptor protein
MDDNHLKSVPLFAGMGRKERRVLASRADEIDIPEGKKLATEGSFAYEFFVIEKGTAEVTIGEERLTELGPGDFFGELGVLASERRTATVTATSPMEVIVLTARALRALDREHPEVHRRLEQAIEERLPRSGAAPLAQ